MAESSTLTAGSTVSSLGLPLVASSCAKAEAGAKATPVSIAPSGSHAVRERGPLSSRIAIRGGAECPAMPAGRRGPS